MSDSADVHILKHLEIMERRRAEWARAADLAMYVGFAAGFVAGAIIFGVVLA